MVVLIGIATTGHCAEVIHSIVDRGPHHAVHQRLIPTLDETGLPSFLTNSWTQLEDGLNYWDTDVHAWAEARPEIEITAAGAVARYLQHRAIFSSNVNDRNGALDVEVQHEVRLRSSVLAVRYYDPLTGTDAVIGVVRDARGELLPPNQVLYRDAFEDLKADVLYTVSKRGIEANLIFREVPPPPEEVGLQAASDRLRLEVVTEFFDPPEPRKRERILDSVDDPLERDRFVEPDWIDEELDFGPNRIGEGRAFAWSAREAAVARPEDFPAVGKRWVVLPEGKTFLVESVAYASLFDELLELPGDARRLDNLRTRQGIWVSRPTKAVTVRALVGTRTSARSRDLSLGKIQRPAPESMPEGFAPSLAKARESELGERGVVIDWTSFATGTYGFTFRGDETYHITGNCWFNGTTTLDGGTVIKFQRCTPTNLWITLCLIGPLDSRTSLYHPAVFTAESDNTVGETIVPGSPDPTADYGDRLLRFRDIGSPVVVEHIRLKHGNYGITFEGDTHNNLVRHAQILNCRYPVYSSTNSSVRLQNLLIGDVKSAGYVFFGTGTAFSGEHLTIHKAPALLLTGTLTLTNSLLNAVASIQGYSGSGNFQSTTDAGIFETVGGGMAYLPIGSSHRNAGQSAIHPALVRDFRNLTTFPPVLLTTAIDTPTVLGARPIRDLDTPDRGYHYAPLDYCLSGLSVDNATLVLTNGVAIGIYGTNGLVLRTNAVLISEGNPAALNRLVRSTIVQESTNTWGTVGTTFSMIDLRCGGATAPIVDLRFTHASHLAVSTNNTTGRRLLLAGYAYAARKLDLSHCLISGLNLDGVYPWYDTQTVCLTNNVFEHCYLGLAQRAGYPAYTLNAYNNLLFRGRAVFQNYDGASVWNVHDNLILADHGSYAAPILSASHNAFGASAVAFGTFAHTNVVGDFVRGPFGRYYYPGTGLTNGLTNLMDRGSRTAAAAGLYHYSTRGDQLSESSTIVDIGFHYPSAGPPGGGLVGFWKLDETSGTTARDSTTNGLHGTLQYGPQWDIDGMVNGCLSFTTPSHVVTVPNSPILEVGKTNSDFSVTFWLQLRQGYTGNWRVLMQKASASTNRTPAFFLNPYNDRLHYRVSTTYNFNEGSDSVQQLVVGSWTHVALVKCANRLQLYLNGLLDSQTTLVGATIHNDGPLRFGDTPWNDGAPAKFDEVRVYSWALSASDIVALQSEAPCDSDSEGLPDYVEDNDGDGVWDAAESSIAEIDTDFDGQSDHEERLEGTDPTNAEDRLATRLSRFSFNTPDLKGDEGQLPIQINGNLSVAGLDGNGVQFTNAGAILRYACVEPNGRANVLGTNCFSARLRFKPNWTSPCAGGNGPGATEAHLLSLGNRATHPALGYLEFFIYGNGDKLFVRTANGLVQRDEESAILTNSVPPYNYVATPFYSNRWSELIVNVQDHTVTVWKDGRCVLNKGFTGYPVPSPAARSLGFSVGARPGPSGVGVEPCLGTIDELEWHNYPPEGFLALAEAGNTTYAEALTNPTAMRLHWRHTIWLPYTNPPARVAIDRRPHGWGGTWTNIATNQTGFQFTDSSIALGQLYDYRFRVQPNEPTGETLPGLTAAVEAPPVLDRGHVLLLVDQTLTNVLSNELDQFTLDLVGDGWQVLTENVPRHIDADWLANTNGIQAIRSAVQARYQTPGIQLKTLIIIGHVAIPYTGMLAEDGHLGWLNTNNPASDNHFGAWSSDLYYADMDGEWTDARLYDHPWGTNGPATRYLITTNTVGDGKFDNNQVPEDTGTNKTYRLELGVGRIDFANLNIFSSPPTSLDEVGLLKRYFHKNHRYRHGQTPVSTRALGRSFREHSSVSSFPAHGQRSLARLFAGSPDGLAEGDFLAATNGLAYLWGYQFGFGEIDAIRNGDAQVHYAATNLVYPDRQPHVAYAMCFGSWFGDWNLGDAEKNNLLRSFLSIEDHGLMALWGYQPWPFLGLASGQGAWRAQVDYFEYYSEIEPKRFPSEQARSVPRVLGILGDPTLGWTPVPVPKEASATDLAGQIVVSWQPVPASQPRYHLRYSEAGPLGPFTTISPVVGTSATSFVHSNAPATRPLYYQVRASVPSQSSSGSSWNLSQAAATVFPKPRN